MPLLLLPQLCGKALGNPSSGWFEVRVDNQAHPWLSLAGFTILASCPWAWAFLFAGFSAFLWMLGAQAFLQFLLFSIDSLHATWPRTTPMGLHVVIATFAAID
jgi:hypothetical protein